MLPFVVLLLTYLHGLPMPTESIHMVPLVVSYSLIPDYASPTPSTKITTVFSLSHLMLFPSPLYCLYLRNSQAALLSI